MPPLREFSGRDSIHTELLHALRELAEVYDQELLCEYTDWNTLREQLWEELHNNHVGRKSCKQEDQTRLRFSIACGNIALNRATSNAVGLRAIDEALIVGHPLAADVLQGALGLFRTSSELSIRCGRSLVNNCSPTEDKVLCDIDQIHRPSISMFLTRYFGQRPVLITGIVESWPAFTKWPLIDFWLENHGLRTVPIERGRTYLSSDFRPELVLLQDFIHDHLLADGDGYLAQHGIFDQIPSLRQDVVEPDFASFGEDRTPPTTNLWLGPENTITPLHYDPQHNLLAQVNGFSPSCEDISHSVSPGCF